MPHSESPPPTPDTAQQYGDFRDDLFRDGFAVVKGVVPKERCDYYIEQMTQWLERFPLGFDRNDPSTWTEEHLPKHMKGGMYHGYGVPHEKFTWEARLEPGVIAAYEKLWDTKELLVSFDGINHTLPLPESKRVATSPWPHVDQNPHHQSFHCAQGIINFAPNGPDDGGLVVMKHSNTLNEAYFKCHSKEKKPEWGAVPENWHSFTSEEVGWFKERGAVETKVVAGPGDLILWDSRTIHWNVLPQSNQIRSLVYTCYTPAAWATPENLQKKGEIFRQRQRTTHMPHANFWRSTELSKFGKDDAHHRELPFEEPVETEQLLKLAGALAY